MLWILNYATWKCFQKFSLNSSRLCALNYFCHNTITLIWKYIISEKELVIDKLLTTKWYKLVKSKYSSHFKWFIIHKNLIFDFLERSEDWWKFSCFFFSNINFKQGQTLSSIFIRISILRKNEFLILAFRILNSKPSKSAN